MNTFFRIIIYFCFILVFFNMAVSLVNALGAFPFVGTGGTTVNSTSEALNTFAGFPGGMAGFWAIAVTGVGIGVVIGVLTSSFVPVGISLFSTFFWGLQIHTWGILSVFGIPSDLLLLFEVGVLFLFIAAVIGMITGSG